MRNAVAAVARRARGAAAPNMKILGVVYVFINNVNGKVYVGQTTSSIVAYMRHKFKYLSKGDLPFQRAMRKYGICNFSYGILAECKNQEELDSAERYYINTLDARNPAIGYNVAAGGHGWPKGTRHTEETKAKISAKALGNSYNKGRKTWNTGLTASTDARLLEFCKKMKGRVSPLRGRVLSEEHRARLSIARRRRVTKPETVEKFKATMLVRRGQPRKKFSNETIERMKLAARKRVITPATREKMARGIRAFHSSTGEK